jgi:hypothetical protein
VRSLRHPLAQLGVGMDAELVVDPGQVGLDRLGLRERRVATAVLVRPEAARVAMRCSLGVSSRLSLC